MSERKKQIAFLKGLIRLQDTEAGRDLQERMAKAEQDERCIRRGLFVVALFGLLSVSGLCYSAVLLPEFFRGSSHVIIKAFSASSLGALLCFLGFLAYWLRYRLASNQLHADCRRFMMSLMESRMKAAGTEIELRVVQHQHSEMYRIASGDLESDSRALGLPKAS